MTAYNARLQGKTPDGHNVREGQPKQLNLKLTSFWGVEGFMPTSPENWTYTWGEGFPIFEVEEIGGETVFVRRGDDTAIFIEIDPQEIKAWLDAEIFEIMQEDADPDGPPLNWSDFEADMAAEGMVIPF